MCGCGGEAPLSKANDVRYGIIKGLPQRYIRGHHYSKSFAHYLVDDDTGCWVWQRAVNSSGYGHLYVNGVHKYAHIHAYEQAHGEVANNGITIGSRQVHHKCGNRLCVNPEHLELVDVREHRSSHGLYHITAAEVPEIRRLAELGELTQREIGKMFGLSQSQVCGIKKRRFWADVK